MQPSTSASLSAMLRRADPHGGGICSGVNGTFLYRDAFSGTSFADAHIDFENRSILLAVPDQLSAALALIQLDGVARRVVLCPPDVGARHYASIVTDADIDAIVCAQRCDEIDALGLSVVTARASVDTRTPFLQGDRRTEWVLLTSGTSGAPKLVLHDLASLAGAIRPTGLEPNAAVWSTFYDIRRYGGLQIFLRAMIGGHCMILSQAEESVQVALRRLGEGRVTHISGTPSHWRRVLMSGAAGLMSPRYVRLSGEIADQAILDALQSTYPSAAISHAYASTEAGVGFNVIDGREGFPAAMIDAPSAGAEVTMKVIDGSLHLKSQRAAARYLGNRHEPIIGDDGFIDTSDLVELRGDRYHFVGRRGGMINVGGAKVYPEEIEAVINLHPLVHMSLVQGRRNPITGALVVADIVLRQGEPDAETGQAIIADILTRCRDTLPPHKVPTKLRIVPHLDVSVSGKLKRPHA
jgi:acyl-coenzyme A synthetase/AMP-(fatty) acid ligase